MTREDTLRVVLEVARAEADDLGYEFLREPTAQTLLYGGEGGLDSLSLVRLIAAVERAAERAFGRRLVLADERAMSMRRSPFRSVETLADLLATRLDGVDGSKVAFASNWSDTSGSIALYVAESARAARTAKQSELQ